MIRRDFLKRMAFAALACGMLGSELESKGVRLGDGEVLVEAGNSLRFGLEWDYVLGREVGVVQVNGQPPIRTDIIRRTSEGGIMIDMRRASKTDVRYFNG